MASLAAHSMPLPLFIRLLMMCLLLLFLYLPLNIYFFYENLNVTWLSYDWYVSPPFVIPEIGTVCDV